jgi:hypothetical protein
MGYLFGPPGWSHDGSRQTSDQMRETENLENKRNNTPLLVAGKNTLPVNQP